MNIFKEPKGVYTPKGVTRCALCGEKGHNKRTCTASVSSRVTKSKKVNKSLYGLAGCINIFKEPKVVYAPKGVTMCALCGEKGHNKRTCTASVSSRVTKSKKVNKSLDGLAGCINIFKEPKVVYPPKGNTMCTLCGEKGHNRRTCPHMCIPCADTPTDAEIRAAKSLMKYLD